MSTSDKNDVKPSSSNLVLKAGDNECWNCVGISFLSKAMADQGQRPTCYGLQYKASVKISEEDMKLLENVPVVPPKAKIFMFGQSNAGLSQASSRMHRQGQVPILKFGVPIVASYDNERKTATPEDTLKPPIAPKNSGGFPLNAGIAPRRPLPNDHPATLSAEATNRIKSSEKSRTETEERIVTSSNTTALSDFEKIAASVERSVTKLWVNGGGALQRLPARMQ
eukprot:gene2540-1843_t